MPVSRAKSTRNRLPPSTSRDTPISRPKKKALVASRPVIEPPPAEQVEVIDMTSNAAPLAQLITEMEENKKEKKGKNKKQEEAILHNFRLVVEVVVDQTKILQKTCLCSPGSFDYTKFAWQESQRVSEFYGKISRD